MVLLQQIVEIFRPQINLEKLSISFEMVSVTIFENSESHGFKKELMPSKSLPELLVGDE